MRRHPVFLSVVCVVHDAESEVAEILARLQSVLVGSVNDYEIVVVDNASADATIATLRRLLGDGGVPNVQVYALTKEVAWDAASWMGVSNSLGDYTAVVDPYCDDVTVLPELLQRAVDGADVVFASNAEPARGPLGYRAARRAFEWLYSGIAGVRISQEAPTYRLLSRRVVNYMLQHPQPAVSYRLLPVTGGFVRSYVAYRGLSTAHRTRSLLDGFDRGMQVLVSTSRAPLRIVTGLSLFGAVANVLYAGYVLLIGLLKQNVEPGWISVSLQQSGMFFLISLVLLVLGEYILRMAALSNEAPDYYLAQEFTSSRLSRTERLNVEAVAEQASPILDV